MSQPAPTPLMFVKVVTGRVQAWCAAAEIAR